MSDLQEDSVVHHNEQDGFLAVMAIKPMWHYCVLFRHSTGKLSVQPAVPFYTKRGAKRCADSMEILLNKFIQPPEQCCWVYVFKRSHGAVDPTPVYTVGGGNAY